MCPWYLFCSLGAHSWDFPWRGTLGSGYIQLSPDKTSRQLRRFHRWTVPNIYESGGPEKSGILKRIGGAKLCETMTHVKLPNICELPQQKMDVQKWGLQSLTDLMIDVVDFKETLFFMWRWINSWTPPPHTLRCGLGSKWQSMNRKGWIGKQPIWEWPCLRKESITPLTTTMTDAPEYTGELL